MVMNGRDVGTEYKFGMNGQIQDREVFNGFMSADFWGYDSRLGRRWEQDPLARDWQSPYCTFDNNPIVFSDPDGLEAKDGPKKGDKYDCGDGTHEVFDGKKYVPEGADGKPLNLPSDAKLQFAKQDFFSKGKLVAAKGQVVAYTIKGETFSHNYGVSKGRTTPSEGFFNEDGETYQGLQDWSESILNGTKHFYTNYEGPNTNSTQEAWKNWLTIYNYSQFLRGNGFGLIEGLPAIWSAVTSKIVVVNSFKIFRTASLTYKGSTVLGHALSKHAQRHPQIWGKLIGDKSTWHKQALKHFYDIIKAPGGFSKTTTKEGINFLEKRLPDGRGMRLNMDGTFKGFID